MEKYTNATDYILSAEGDAREGLVLLRQLLLESGLKEEIKWGGPCYTLDGKNVAGLAAFKSYIGLWFFQGAFLKDEKKVLVNANEGNTRGMRQWRFQSSAEIEPELVRQYLTEAIENQRQGKTIVADRQKPLGVPEVLAEALRRLPAVEQSFAALSLSKKREYVEYIAEAKQEATKAKRLEKILPLIEAGMGLHDKYRPA